MSPFIRSPFRRLWPLIAWLVTASTTLAVTTDQPLTLGGALAQALLKNPSLQAYAFESRIAEARLLQAGIRPNPELSVGVENVLGTGALSGVKGLETTLQLSQVIDLGGSRARQVEVADRERDLTDADYETKRVDVFATVARRFIEVVADKEILVAARRALAISEQTVTSVDHRLKAAVATPLELHQARIEQARRHLDEEHAEHELLSHRHSLAAILGEPEPSFGDLSAELFTLPAVPEFPELAARLEKSPMLARFAVETRWHEAQLRLNQSLQRSGTRVSAGLRRVENTDDFGFVAGFSLPIPIRNQHAGIQRENRERRDQVAANAEAMRLEMRATLFDIYQEMIHARTGLTQLQQTVIPMAEETLSLADQGYRAGRYSLLEVLTAQQALIELQTRRISFATLYHVHAIEIERLLGAPLQGSPNGS